MLAKTLSNKQHIIKRISFALILIMFICAIIISPSKYVNVTLNGIMIWATAILPALFPFILFTKLLTSTGIVSDLSKGFSGVTKKMYKTSGISSYIFLMSILSGYPLGAKITSDLYEQGTISRSEAHRICSFTSNSGPMFIVGTVGVELLLNAYAGYIILISHILSAILNGLIYRNYSPQQTANMQTNAKQFSDKDIITTSMENSISSILIIGGYITIFFVITEILSSLGIFNPLINLLSLCGVEKSISSGIIYGFFEMTNGCLLVASAPVSIALKTIICSLIISFGGLAVSFQAFAFLNKFKISKRFFFLQKTTQAIIACILATILSVIFL